MVKGEFDFETWFGSLAAMVLDSTFVEFRDEDSVRDDYEAGKNCGDVADEIAAEYDCGYGADEIAAEYDYGDD